MRRNLRILREYFLQQELLRKAEAGYDMSALSLVNEFTPLVVAHVVVTDVGRLLVLDAGADLPLREALSHHVMAYADTALQDEIHL